MPEIELSYTPELAEYIRSVTPKEPEVLGKLREETSALPDSQMQISPEQGQFFSFLVRAIGAKKCLEIGVFTGYSSISVALALPPDGSIVACDRSDEWTSIARRYWREAGVENKIDLRLGPALETLDRLISEGHGGTFDFAFIDADKPNYLNYWERCLTLVRKGGVIAVDNVLWSARVIDPADQEESTRFIREFNEMAGRDPRVSMTMLAIRDGITLAYKL